MCAPTPFLQPQSTGQRLHKKKDAWCLVQAKRQFKNLPKAIDLYLEVFLYQYLVPILLLYFWHILNKQWPIWVIAKYSVQMKQKPSWPTDLLRYFKMALLVV